VNISFNGCFELAGLWSCCSWIGSGDATGRGNKHTHC